MAHLCFLLDLRNISSSLLRDLKQSLLQLSDLYAACAGGRDRLVPHVQSLALPNRIGLCYIQSNESASTELKIAFTLGGNFSLLNFHHAVYNLPMNFPDEFSGNLPIEGDNQVEVSIRKILSNEFLDMWGVKGVLKKVIVITTSAFTSSESLLRILMKAGTQHVKIEFVLLEQDTILSDESLENLSRSIVSLNQLRNCVAHKHISDTWTLYGLVKGWLHDLRDGIDACHAHFVFKHAVYGSSNQISCLLSASSDNILDGFSSSQTCRCHGCPIGYTWSKTKKDVCPVTFLELEESDLVDSAVKVGDKTVLFLPSSENRTNLQKEGRIITLNVIERTNLASVDEGVIMGTSYYVTPLCHEWEDFSDGNDNLEMNLQYFYGICESLLYLDQGLVCSSSCNLETMTDGRFMSFYLLQPSYCGPMLLRRLASSEELLSIPSQVKKAIVAEEIKNSIQVSLSMVELRDYNPLEHERGLYPQLNKLVEGSLASRSLPTEFEMTPTVEDTLKEKSSAPDKPSATVIFEKENADRDENTISGVSDEWEKLLIVDGLDDSFSAGSISASKAQSLLPRHEKSLDERTCRILERLEAPKPSPYISSASVVNGQTTKPLHPSDPSSFQPLRPNFQRTKKLRQFS